MSSLPENPERLKDWVVGDYEDGVQLVVRIGNLPDTTHRYGSPLGTPLRLLRIRNLYASTRAVLPTEETTGLPPMPLVADEAWLDTISGSPSSRRRAGLSDATTSGPSYFELVEALHDLSAVVAPFVPLVGQATSANERRMQDCYARARALLTRIQGES